MKNIFFSFFALSIFILFSSCDSSNETADNEVEIHSVSKKTNLPYLGFHEVDSLSGDTLFHQIRPFEFINQDSQKVTNATFNDKVYVVDFFFISCPTICPKLKKQMLRLYDRYEKNDELLILSHTVDTKHDTIPRLKKYAQNLGAAPEKWHFVTGEKDDIYEIAEDYFSVALENEDAPGGYDHSGRIILVDKKGHVRSFCNGTDPAEVDEFMNDIDWLLEKS